MITLNNYIEILKPVKESIPAKLREVVEIFVQSLPDYLEFPILIEENKEVIDNHLKMLNDWYNGFINKKTEHKIERSNINPFINPIKNSCSVNTQVIERSDSCNERSITHFEKDIIDYRMNDSGVSVRQLIKKHNKFYWDYTNTLKSLVERNLVDIDRVFKVKFGRPKK